MTRPFPPPPLLVAGPLKKYLFCGFPKEMKFQNTTYTLIWWRLSWSPLKSTAVPGPYFEKFRMRIRKISPRLKMPLKSNFSVNVYWTKSEYSTNKSNWLSNWKTKVQGEFYKIGSGLFFGGSDPNSIFFYWRILFFPSRVGSGSGSTLDFRICRD